MYHILLLLFCAMLAFVSTTTRPAKQRGGKKSEGGGGFPKGPRLSLPVIGNLWMIGRGKDIHETLTDLSKYYGDVFSFDLGQKRMVVVNSIGAAKEALLGSKGAVFAGRPDLVTGDMISRGNKNIAFASYGPVWKLHRKLSHAAIHMFGKGIAKLERSMNEQSDRLCAALAGFEGRDLDPTKEVGVAIANVICNVAFGSEFDRNDPKFVEIIDYNQEFVESLGSGSVMDLFPFLKHFPIAAKKRLQHAVGVRDRVISAQFKQHEETLDESNIRDFTDALLKAHRDAKEGENGALAAMLDRDHLEMTMSDVFSGGFETTTTTMRWMLAFMAYYPQVQQKMHDEIDENIGEAEHIEYKHREELNYVNAVIHEITRIRPISTLLIPHQTTQDTSLSGYDIPAGTMVTFNAWAMHHDSQYWDEPYTFRPERFLDGDGKFHMPNPSFMPFSMGRRVCLGETMARMEVFIFLTKILQNYHIVPSSEGLPCVSKGIPGLAFSPFPYKVRFLAKPKAKSFRFD